MEGLLAGLAGQGQGRQQGYQDALALQAQQQQFLEQQRQFNENLKLQRASSGLDLDTGQPIAPIIPKQYSQILPGNKGKGTPTDDDYVKHYLGLAGANVRNPLYSNAFANIASQYGLGAERTATAAYTSGAKTDLAHAQIDLDKARVQVLTQIQPEQFKLKLGEDRDKYIYQAQAQYARMASNQKEREYLATLNAYYRFQGYSQQDAFRASIAQYQQESQNYRQAINPRNALLDPTAAAGAQMPQAPTTNINISLPAMINAAQRFGVGGQGAGAGAGGGGGGGTAAIDQDFSLALKADPNIDPDPVVSGVVHAMRAHPARAMQNVQTLVAMGSMTQAEAQKAMMIYGRSKTQGGRSGPRIPFTAPQTRLNQALGGSQAALPFALPQP